MDRKDVGILAEKAIAFLEEQKITQVDMVRVFRKALTICQPPSANGGGSNESK